MKQFLIAGATLAVLAAFELAVAAQGMAVPLGGQTADDAMRTLQGQGYTVQINQSVTVPLSRCIVTNVSGLRGVESDGALSDLGRANVVFMDVDCTH